MDSKKNSDMKERMIQVLNEGLGTNLTQESIQFQRTKDEHEGDFTLVLFPLLKMTGLKMGELVEKVTSIIKEKCPEVEKMETVGGFLNLTITPYYWYTVLLDMTHADNYGIIPPSEHSKNIVLEYSSPNTNKPLHLGHVRNNLLGWSVSEILKANGHSVTKVQIINDRGIHICKSMAAWEKYGQGKGPGHKKGDHYVGEFYVKFNETWEQEVKHLVSEGMVLEEAEENSPIMTRARELLTLWESGDHTVRQVWEMMNGWVYDGFSETYDSLGVDFDHLYYESDTYLIGKDIVMKGLEDGIFYCEQDGSVWCDLTDEGLGKKLLLRSDGTSVYMTQDLGTALLRKNDYPQSDSFVYVVGSEQEHHFKVLFAILKKLGHEWAKDCHHLSYGMVELPDGRLKSREGKVVDADNLMDEVIQAAKIQTSEKSEVVGMGVGEFEKLTYDVGMGAIKYHILKVDPTKKTLFDPKKSISLLGDTGPFIQYSHVRACSILLKTGIGRLDFDENLVLNDHDRNLLGKLCEFPETIKTAGSEFSPATVAQYMYDVAKTFNRFYHECPINKEPDEVLKQFRIGMTLMTKKVLSTGMGLLGINVPERM